MVQDQPQVPSYNETQSYYKAPIDTLGSSVIILTNPSDVLHEMELALRSIYKDSNNVIHQYDKPLLNDLGISAVMGMAQSLVNRVTVLSNYDRHEINHVMDDFCDVLIKDLMINRIKYEITLPTARARIVTMARNICTSCMKRADIKTISDKKWLRGAIQEISTRVEGNQNRRGGIMSRLNPWAKN